MPRALVAALLVVAGCTAGELDVVGKACPCPSDLVCDPKTQTCVRTSSGSGGGGASTSTGGGGGETGGAGPCASTCGTPGCGECPTSSVVAVDAFDIDATEVTAAAYMAFVAANVELSTQPPYCAWNTSYAPIEDDTDAGCTGPLDVVEFPDRPAVCIDWCDAYAYCAWAKRHLCGRIGGGKLMKEQAGDPSLSEWHRACTNAGTKVYPYGDVYEEGRCNTANSGFGATPVEVGLAIDCVGGYAGLHDMSGNVEEWEDSCGNGVDPDDPSDDGCTVRGGAYWTQDADSRCDGLAYAPPRNMVSNDWGFRCCGPTR